MALFEGGGSKWYSPYSRYAYPGTSHITFNPTLMSGYRQNTPYGRTQAGNSPGYAPMQQNSYGVTRSWGPQTAQSIDNKRRNVNKGTVGSGAVGFGTVGQGTVGAGTSGQPQLPSISMTDVYAKYIAELEQLKKQAGNLNWNYTPEAFQYEEWNPGDEYLSQARTRANSDMAAQAAIWNEQEAQNIRNYRAAIQQANEEQQRQVSGIDRTADMEAGALANMAANMGMNTGAGAITERFGLDQAFADQKNAVASQYGLARAAAALDQANLNGQVGAERASARAGLGGRIDDLRRALEEEAYGRYNNERGFAFDVFGDNQNRKYQNAESQYTAALNSLMNRLGIVGQQAGLAQDTRDYMAGQQWNLYDALMNAFNSNRNYDLTVNQNDLLQGNWQAEFDRDDDEYQALLRQLGMI